MKVWYMMDEFILNIEADGTWTMRRFSHVNGFPEWRELCQDVSSVNPFKRLRWLSRVEYNGEDNV